MEQIHKHENPDGTVTYHTHATGEVHMHSDGSMHTHALGEAHVHSDGSMHTHAPGEAHIHSDGSVHAHASGETHVHSDGTVHTHAHGHGHYHHHENTKAVLNRLSRAIGHLESIKRMVEDGRDCSEVLIQLSAVKSAINNTGKVILEDHIKHCLVDAIESGDMEAIEELNKAIDRFIK